MQVLKWTPDFKAEEETTIVPVWILNHQLPWQLFNWQIVAGLVTGIRVAVAPLIKPHILNLEEKLKLKLTC